MLAGRGTWAPGGPASLFWSRSCPAPAVYPASTRSIAPRPHPQLVRCSDLCVRELWRIWGDDPAGLWRLGRQTCTFPPRRPMQ